MQFETLSKPLPPSSSKNKYTFSLYLFIFHVDFRREMQYNNTDILCKPYDH